MHLAGDRNDRTLQTYELAAERYAAHMTSRPPEAIVAFIDSLLQLLPPAPRILEIGSATGRDADLLEQRGATVVRTDAASSFVRRLRDAGRDAALVNVLKDDLGGPYDGIYANAVLLHVPRELLPGVLDRAHAAVHTGGVLGFTVKAGEGDAWSEDDLGRPRFFAYWTADALRQVVDRSPWQLVAIADRAGTKADWLHVLCRRAG